MMKCIRCDNPVSGNPFFCDEHSAGGNIVAAVNDHHASRFSVQQEYIPHRGRVSGRVPMETIKAAKTIMQKRRDEGHDETISSVLSAALSQYVTRYRRYNE